MTLQKRVFDLVFAVVLMILLSPVFLCLLILLMLTQGRPVFYVSERMKTPSVSFDLVKFRTMTVVSEDRGVSGGDKAARVTPMGKWLRRYRLDELPQLWNILRGDLSFVGPRPPLREYVEQFPDIYGEVLQSCPGVTGLATLRFHRHEERLLNRCKTPAETDAVYRRICVPRKARLDQIYQRHQNLCFDIGLIYATLRGVLAK